MPPSRHWSISARVRADEDSMFVPHEMLADAAPGDVVEVISDGPPTSDGSSTTRSGTTRSGRIIAGQRDPTRGEFWIVELDAPH